MSIWRNIAVAAMVVGLGSAPLAAAEKPSGRISIDQTQFGFLIGGNVGGGTLTFKGKTHKFKIGGISIGKIGASKLRGYGEVYNLTDISKFAGTYVAADASATAGKGEGTLRLKNSDGVILQIETKTKGLELSASGGGVKITLE